MIVDCAHYCEGERMGKEALDVDEAARIAKAGTDFVWLGMHEPDDDELEHVAEAFGLHELAVEDASTRISDRSSRTTTTPSSSS